MLGQKQTIKEDDTSKRTEGVCEPLLDVHETAVWWVVADSVNYCILLQEGGS